MGRGTTETGDQPHAKAIAHAPGTPLRSPDPARDAVSVAGREGPEAVPHTRAAQRRLSDGLPDQVRSFISTAKKQGWNVIQALMHDPGNLLGRLRTA